MIDSTISNLSSSKPMTTIVSPPPMETLAENQQPDAELLAIFLETGSRSALEPLVVRYSGLVYSVVSRVVYLSQDREDACQATFLTLVRSASRIRNQRSIASWLYSVAFRIAMRIKQQSRSKLHPLSMDDVQSIEPPAMDPLVQISQEMEFEKLRRELQQLPQPLRDTLFEHYFLGHTASAIAERMELSVSAVEGRLRRGKQRLRRELAKKGIGLSIALGAASHFTSVAQASSDRICELCLQAIHYGSATSSAAALSAATTANGATATSNGATAASHSINAHVLSLVQGEMAMSTIGLTKVASGLALGVCALFAASAVTQTANNSGQFRSGRPSLAMSTTYAGEAMEDETPLMVGDQGPGGASGGGGGLAAGSADSSGGAGVSGFGAYGGLGGAVGPIGGVPTGGGAVGESIGGGASPGGYTPGGGYPGMGPAGMVPGAGMGGMPGMEGGSDQGRGPGNTNNRTWMERGVKASNKITQAKKALENHECSFELLDSPQNLLREVASSTGLPIVAGTDSDLGELLAGGKLRSVNTIVPTDSKLTLEVALGLLLEANQLEMVIHANKIEIWTESDAPTEVRLYNVRGLIKGQEESEKTNLIELVASHVLKDALESHGGTSKVSVVGLTLVADCSPKMHKKIEVFLSQLAEIDEGLESLSKMPTEPIGAVPGIGGFGDGMGAGGMGGGAGGMGGGGGGFN